jgi:hypothetical protein
LHPRGHQSRTSWSSTNLLLRSQVRSNQSLKLTPGGVPVATQIALGDEVSFKLVKTTEAL